MSWNDYEAAWKRQEPPVGAGADVEALRTSFEPRSRKMHGALVVRDLSEASAGVLVSAFFAYFGWREGREAWPIAIAVALLLGVTAIFVRERIGARRRRPGPDSPLLAKLDADIAELRHQRQLILRVRTWYLAPIVAAWAIVVGVSLRIGLIHAPPGFYGDLMRNPITAAFVILYFGVVAPLCFWGTWVINRRAVSRRMEPRIDELEKLRRAVLGQP
jgi:hypothetical protein